MSQKGCLGKLVIWDDACSSGRLADRALPSPGALILSACAHGSSFVFVLQGAALPFPEMVPHEQHPGAGSDDGEVAKLRRQTPRGHAQAARYMRRAGACTLLIYLMRRAGACTLLIIPMHHLTLPPRSPHYERNHSHFLHRVTDRSKCIGQTCPLAGRQTRNQKCRDLIQ